MMMYIVLTSFQATSIQAVINSQPGGVLSDGWTVDVLAGKLTNGQYAIQESIKDDLIAHGLPNYRQVILDNTGIDVDELPVLELTQEDFFTEEL